MYYLIVDIETTGLNKLKDTPIQIAWQVLNNKRQKVGKGSYYINPIKPISKTVIAITGIAQETLSARGYIDTVAANKYRQLVWKWQPCTLVGHNLIGFDFPILHNWLERFYSGPFKQPPIVALEDTMHMASIKWHTKKWLKLEECGRRLEILFNKEQLHNAEADVALTTAVYLGLIEK
jgi:DNA polymerase III alpha subunit (gram-positive type)